MSWWSLECLCALTRAFLPSPRGSRLENALRAGVSTNFTSGEQETQCGSSIFQFCKHITLFSSPWAVFSDSCMLVKPAAPKARPSHVSYVLSPTAAPARLICQATLVVEPLEAEWLKGDWVCLDPERVGWMDASSHLQRLCAHSLSRVCFLVFSLISLSLTHTHMRIHACMQCRYQFSYNLGFFCFRLSINQECCCYSTPTGFGQGLPSAHLLYVIINSEWE